jgi:S1-C subfamily serine protease
MDPRIGNLQNCRSGDIMRAPCLSLLLFLAVSLTRAWAESAPALSQKPTFRCETAQTSIERIICLERFGPNVDWDLSAAYWARLFLLDQASQDGFVQAHKQWHQSVYRSCGLTLDQATWSRQQGDCVLGAFQARARLYRSQLSGDALIESQMSPEQRAQLQVALLILGFFDDEADGEFGPLTRGAVRSFQESNGFPQSNFLTERQRTALLTQAYARQNSAAPASPSPNERKAEQKMLAGTGFFVSPDGQVLTNAHVVEGCATANVIVDGRPPAAGRVAARDTKNDLALIQTGLNSEKYASFRLSIRLGDQVAAFGFPLAGLLSQSGNFTLGNITGMAGIGDDTSYVQISTPVQQGSSGGPLVDYSGNVVGIVTGKLNAIKAVAVTGDLPQNVNFAVKSVVATSFLESNRVSYSTGSTAKQMEPADLADHARSISVFIECRP